MNASNFTPTDDQLLAFSLGDPSLTSDEVAQIRALVASDATVAERLGQVSTSLAAAFESPEPDDAFEERLYEHVRWQLPREVRRIETSVQHRDRPAWRTAFALAAGLAVAIGLGYGLGRLDSSRDVTPVAANGSTSQPAPNASTPLLADDAATRVLVAHLVEHLEDAERALLVAENSPDEGETAQQLAAGLVESNRLYAAAATRAGRPQLAQFLRELEPIFIELANRDGRAGSEISTDDIAAEIRDQDLTFKTRAAAALAKRELSADELKL